VIDGGYGKLKGLAFRISNMGDETDATIVEIACKPASTNHSFSAPNLERSKVLLEILRTTANGSSPT
jgi:aspartate aminotransferase-like enzyme